MRSRPSGPSCHILRDVWCVKTSTFPCIFLIQFNFNHLPLPAHSHPLLVPSTPGLPLHLLVSIPPEVNAGMLTSVVSPSPRINNMATAALQGWTLARHGTARRGLARYTSRLSLSTTTNHHWHHSSILHFCTRAKDILSSLCEWKPHDSTWKKKNVKGTAMPAPAADATTPAAFNRIDLFIRWMLEGLMESCEAMHEKKTKQRWRPWRRAGCGMSTSPWPHSCNSTLGRLPTMSALAKKKSRRINAHTASLSLTHAHTATYNSFMSIFFGGAVYPSGEQLQCKGPETGSIPPSDKSLLSPLASLPPLPLYVILPPQSLIFFKFTSWSGPRRGVAVARRAPRRPVEQTTHRKGWFTSARGGWWLCCWGPCNIDFIRLRAKFSHLMFI